MSTTEPIELSRTEQVARLTINRPARHNALDPVALGRLAELLQSFASDPTLRAVVLTGAGEQTFCSGADLTSVTDRNLPADLFEQVTGALAAVPVPTLAAMNGNVFGGGVDLALACDFRLGLTEMRIRVPAVDLGLCYPPTSIARMTRMLGERAAKRLLVLGSTLRGPALLTCGFADLLVAPAEFTQTVEAWISQLSAGAPLAQRAMKAIVQMTAEHRYDDPHARELALRCARSEDLREGLLARSEKRAPAFKGR